MAQTISGLLEKDHEELSELLRELQLALRSHEPNQSFELLDLFWARLAMHIRAENLCLFPIIRNSLSELFRELSGVPSIVEAEATIESLRADHNFFMDELSRAVKKMRDVRTTLDNIQISKQLDEIRRLVAALSIRLDAHNELEEGEVYKWPGLVLSASDLESLCASLKHELENLPPRFAGRSRIHSKQQGNRVGF